MEDQNPGLDGAGEGAEDLELELETTPQGDGNPEPSGDPLDDIQDEKVRADAKKWRAIARRVDKPEPAKAEEPVVVPPPTSSEFLTKADFHKANERKAVREATADADVKANWNEIIPFYTSRRGKETTEDILEDIKDAITLYNARNPKEVTDDSADQLTTTAVVKTGGSGSGDSKTTSKAKAPPNFKLPTPPVAWYPKKS